MKISLHFQMTKKWSATTHHSLVSNNELIDVHARILRNILNNNVTHNFFFCS
jgi:hypothetical protein